MNTLSRRTLLAGSMAAAAIDPVVPATAARLIPSLPLRWPGEPAGAGFRIGHAFQSENTCYLPGYWHCGEDWYATDRDTAGAEVLALTGGDVVFVGSDYPGRVVIVHHTDDLFSMYGHLDYAVSIEKGDQVAAGDVLGTVLGRADSIPNHLHYEVRTFLTTPDVNGTAPRYGFACGPECAPGPGYWPMDAPDLPVDQGWRNPCHVYAELLQEVFAERSVGIDVTTLIHGTPSFDDQDDHRQATTLPAGLAGELLDIACDDPASEGTGAAGTVVWGQIRVEQNAPVWVRLFVPSNRETGSDGRPSSLELALALPL